jgi:hypothetical protein
VRRAPVCAPESHRTVPSTRKLAQSASGARPNSGRHTCSQKRVCARARSPLAPAASGPPQAAISIPIAALLLFEPLHGPAPGIVGTGKPTPLESIRAATMADHLELLSATAAVISHL